MLLPWQDLINGNIAIVHSTFVYLNVNSQKKMILIYGIHCLNVIYIGPNVEKFKKDFLLLIYTFFKNRIEKTILTIYEFRVQSPNIVKY